MNILWNWAQRIRESVFIEVLLFIYAVTWIPTKWRWSNKHAAVAGGKICLKIPTCIAIMLFTFANTFQMHCAQYFRMATSQSKYIAQRKFHRRAISLFVCFSFLTRKIAPESEFKYEWKCSISIRSICTDQNPIFQLFFQNASPKKKCVPWLRFHDIREKIDIIHIIFIGAY